MAHLKLAGIRKSYRSPGAPPATILHGVDLDIADGEFVVFVGPSGCGKSTLLRAICGLDHIDSGDISSAARASTTCRRPNVAWRWCSRVTRCTRT
jgi:ABC-type sugar transport system ATPase subunit